MDSFRTPFGIARADERHEAFAGQLPGLVGETEPVRAGHPAEYPGHFLVYDLDASRIDRAAAHWIIES